MCVPLLYMYICHCKSCVSLSNTCTCTYVIVSHVCPSLIHVVRPGFVSYKKGCTRLAAGSDKVFQLLAHGRWFSPGTPAFSTTETGRHDIAEILLKVALKLQKSNQINLIQYSMCVIVSNFCLVTCKTIKRVWWHIVCTCIGKWKKGNIFINFESASVYSVLTNI